MFSGRSFDNKDLTFLLIQFKIIECHTEQKVLNFVIYLQYLCYHFIFCQGSLKTFNRHYLRLFLSMYVDLTGLDYQNLVPQNPHWKRIIRLDDGRGGSRPKLKGGQLGEGAPKTQWKISAPKARENFWGFIRENSLVFLLNNALVYMFRRIQNESLKKYCI